MANLKEGSIDSTRSELMTSNQKNPDHLSGLKLFTTMFALCLVGFLFLLDVSVISTAIPKITTDFHSLEDVGWYGASYLLALSACQPLTGKIYAEFNIKWTLIFFFLIFEIGSAVCGAATSSTMLIIGRAIAGIGSSGILNGAYGIIYACVPLPNQPSLLGILMGVSQLGVLSGPLIGGALTQHVSWRWCFYINLPCGVPAALGLLFISVPSKGDAIRQPILDRLRKLDLVGFLFFAPAVIQFILALEWGGTKFPWNDATIIGLFCGSFGTLLIFIAWEHRIGEQAMIPLSIIRRRIIWMSCLNYVGFVGSMLTATYYIPIYFQTVRNALPTMSGVDLLPSVVATLISGIATGPSIAKLGYYLPFAIASATIVAIASGIISTWTPTTTTGIWIGYQILLGAGRGMGFQIPIVAVQNNSPKEEVPIVNALVVLAQNLGGAVFLSLDQIIFSSSLKQYLPIYAPSVDSEVVIAAGAVGFRGLVPAESIDGILMAYSRSFDRVMYLAAGAGGFALLFSFGMGWKNIKAKKIDEVEAVAALGTVKA